MPVFAIPFPFADPNAPFVFPPFEIGPLTIAIRWYALAYIAGLLTGWRYCLLLADRPPRHVARRDIDDFLTWATLGVVLGGRVGYVLFYKPGYYIDHPIETLYLWHGGMSFHGGALGVTIAILLFTRARALPVFAFADIICAAIPIGLFFGRIANFINGELWGRVTDMWWAMIFPGGAQLAAAVPPEFRALCRQVSLLEGPGLNCPRHPSQLYEASCEGVLLFVLLLVLERWGARSRPGILTGVFLGGYAIARMSGELLRQPDANLGFEPLGFSIFGMTMGQLLSIPVLVAGIALILWAWQRTPVGPPHAPAGGEGG
jgi:phosphatidylglycerol:prolipoprotein diacylglycerol transferase